MGNLIPSNNNDDNLDFNPTKLPGCKVWLDATDESTLFSTDYQGSVTVPDNFTPTSVGGCSTWYDSSDDSTLYNTSAGPVTAASSPTDVNGCALWLDAADSSSLYISNAGPVTTISSPLDISGCQGWWDASDLTSIFQDSAQTTPVTSNDHPVAVLRDKSGSNIHAIQSSSNNSRPLYKTNVPNANGRSALYFDGVDDFLLASRPASSNHTILAVLYPTVTLAGAASPISINSLACFHPFVGDIRWFASNDGAYIGGTVLFDLFPQIIGWTNNNSSITAYKNSNVAFSGTADANINAAGLQIGRRDSGMGYFTGYICEIVCYNKVLSLSERASVEQYFTNKWGIAQIHGLSTSNNPVGYWQDKSGNNYHAIQQSQANRPLRSSFPLSDKNGISFTKSQTHYLTINNYPYTASSNFTLFIVFKPSTLSANDVILGQNHPTCFATALWYSGTGITLRDSGGGQGFLYNDLNPAVLTISRSSSTAHSAFRNGDHIGEIAASAVNSTSLADLLSTIGASCSGNYPYNGHIGEIIAFNRNLSLEERGRIEKYLLAKWNMTDPHVQSASNGSIGYWGDKSGKNRHARQTISGYRPTRSGTINSLSAITFDGTDDHFLIGDLSSDFPNFGEVFIVFEVNGPSNLTYQLYQTSTNYPIYRYAGDFSYFGAFTSSRTSGASYGIPNTGVHLTSMRANSSSMWVRFDGSQLYSQNGLGYNGGNSHAIGWANHGAGGIGGPVMNGKIVEVITYNTDIGSENRAKVEQYLAKKWGIDRNLHKTSKNIGDKIGYVKDKGAEKTFLSQLNHDNRPKIGTLSNKKAIDFTQSSANSYLQTPYLTTTSNAFSFFVVYSHNNTNSTLFTLGTQDALRLISKYAGNTITYGGSNRLFYSNTPYQLSVPKIESVLKTVGGTNSTFTRLYVNGQLATPASSAGLASEMTSSDGWLVLSGYNSPYTAQGHNNFIIGEFIYYNRALSDQERQLVEQYLYKKWNVDNLTYSISKPTDIRNCILWLDADDNSTLFQNPTASNNITTDGQSVAYWADKAGGQDVAQSTVSARPTYRTNIFKDKPALYFDGGDDLLSLVNRQTSSPCTMIVVCRIDLHSGDLSGIICYGDTTGGNSGPAIIYSPAYRPFLDGAGAGGSISSVAQQSILGKPSIITGIYTQNRTTNSYMYINGFFQQYYTGAGAPLAGSSPRVQIGARTGGGFSTRRMIGYIAECIVYDRVLTDVERASVENYLSDKWGIGSESSPSTIGSQIKLHNIKVSNKEAQNWVDRVFQNGGTVSQKTADSVNQFCKQIESAGMRKKFYRLNLFCGNDLQSCLTPLYLGPDSNTFYGFRTESNTGFVGNNYDEKNGLISTTQGNHLLTGVSFDAIGASDTGHLSFYQTQYNIDTNQYAGGNRSVIGGGSISISFHDFTNVHYLLAYHGPFIETGSAYFGGLFISNRSSATSFKSYEQGNIISQDSRNMIYQTAQTSQVGIFTNTAGSLSSGFTYTNGYLKGYSFGSSMSDAEISSYNSIMESFQTSLGRGLPIQPSAQFASVTNSEAKSWIDAVYANNGTVSASTALAVNNFCNSIDAAGLRNKFYRLNLFCGNNINSCFVPLYRGPSRLGGRHGNQRDVNFSLDGYYANIDNFNYIENQGLLGNTQEIAGNSFVSRRFLNTGFIFGNVTALNNNLHYAVYSKNLTNGGYAMGTYESASMGFSLQIGLDGYNVGAYANSLLNTSNTSTTINFPTRKGLYVGNYSNYILNLYEGRANVVGQRDLTVTYALTPASTSPVGIFAENRQPPSVPLFNYLDRLQGYSIGAALTSTDVQNYYDIMQTFQAALSRAQQTTLSSTFDTITNADARDWLTRVYENGGTVSLTTASAVQNFCNTIDSAGLRGKFFRLNLFCGDNLNAATVPLYRGPSVGGTQHGFLIDINNNFISADYNESGSFAGIKGNGSNKRLDTGLGTYFTNNSSFSMGAFITEPTSVEFSNYLGAMQTSYNNGTQLYYRDRFTRGLDGATFFPPAPNNGIITDYHVYSRTGTLNQFHVNNSLVGTSSSATAASRGSHTIQVHALNNAGSMEGYGNGRISMYHIGLGLTSSESTTLYGTINTFNAAMNRTRPSDSFVSVTNEDAKIWLDNVYYNGGTVSNTTANLVNTFCNSIDSAGLRNKFFRVNLFCGDNLASCLVPLYRGPNKTLIYGGVKNDTNNNFVASNYSENSGLIGNGSSRWLDTGLPQNYAAGRHFGCVVNKLGSTVYRVYMGAKANSSDFIADTRLNIDANLTQASFWTGNDVGQLSTGISNQIAEKTLVLASSVSGGVNKLYSDTIGSNTVSSYANTNTTTIGIFAQKVGQTSTGTGYTDARLSFYTIGTDLTDSEVVTLTGIVDSFNDGLNRGKPSSAFPSVTNADAKMWINNVYANGGTISQSTANAVNVFCNSIDSAGVRDRFYRLNLFAGNNLAAAMVPLYRGTSLAGTQFGNDKDTNVNFVSDDYNETGINGGILGNGGGKQLRTGLTPALVGGTTGHYSAYARNINSDNAIQRLMGSDDNYFAYMFAGTISGYWGSATSVSSSALAGTMLFQRESNILMRCYANGSLQATETSSASPPSSTSEYMIFTNGSFPNPGQGWYTRLGGYSIGLNMTAGQVSQFHSILQAFQTALSRQV